MAGGVHAAGVYIYGQLSVSGPFLGCLANSSGVASAGGSSRVSAGDGRCLRAARLAPAWAASVHLDPLVVEVWLGRGAGGRG